MAKKSLVIGILCLLVSKAQSQNLTDEKVERTFYSADEFAMGVDLSYTNQILDHSGTYRDSGSVE